MITSLNWSILLRRYYANLYLNWMLIKKIVVEKLFFNIEMQSSPFLSLLFILICCWWRSHVNWIMNNDKWISLHAIRIRRDWERVTRTYTRKVQGGSHLPALFPFAFGLPWDTKQQQLYVSQHNPHKYVPLTFLKII